MPPLQYSRLTVPRRASDDSVLGLLLLHAPLGFETLGEDLIAFFREADIAREAAARLSVARIRHELTTDIPEGDALELYRARSRPFSLGRRLWIEPGDPGDAAPPAGRLVLRVPASRAFGTGEHASTRLALLALEDESLEERSVLDVGTGSGILALAAAALGAARVAACDIDADAVFVARENLGRHCFGGRVALFAGGPSACSGVFDLVVANLLAAELLAEAPRLLAGASATGRVILSGIAWDREPEVLACVGGEGWKVTARRAEAEWICLCLTRG